MSGDGRGCSGHTGQFSLEELTRGPGVGVTRFSITFEQHCDGATPALRGVVNYQATGAPDPTPVPDRVIPLEGKIFRVAYDAVANVAYGLDATNMRIGKIDLTTGLITYVPVAHVPNDGCVDSARGRLFVVNKGSPDHHRVRGRQPGVRSRHPVDEHGPGPPPRRSSRSSARTTGCTRSMAPPPPALFTVEGLDGTAPVVTDHSAQLSDVIRPGG